MAEDVVDLLESIEIDTDDGKLGFVMRRMLKRDREMLAEHGAIGQARQRIVMRQIFDSLLRETAFGHVLVRRDPTATGHRAVFCRDASAVGKLDIAAAGVSQGNTGENFLAIFFRITSENAELFSVFHQVTQRTARHDLVGRQPINIDISLIAQNQPRIAIDMAGAGLQGLQRRK